MTVLLSLSSVNKSFAGQKILKDLSLQVKEHELVAVLGSSGSGKTTLLQVDIWF
jgi:ABC-type Fe3+/spermidine/putrescine transport system ATPase subunit